MPDIDFDDTLAGLRVDTERLPLAGAGDVRRRGDQRTQRTIAATGLTAALCLFAAFIGLGGVGDGKKSALDTPATQPKLTDTSLLIADEWRPTSSGAPAWISDDEWQVTSTTEGEGTAPVTSCQQGTIADLGAGTMWSRSFVAKSPQTIAGAPVLEARQVTAQFESPEEASAAFEKVDGWFDSCAAAINGAPERWAALQAAGGRGQVTQLVRRDAAGQPIYENVGYAVNGNAITIVSFEYPPQDPLGAKPEAGEYNPLDVELRFALQRLSGARTLTANAIPAAFTFAEERSGNWTIGNVPGGDFAVARDSRLGTEWLFSPCNRYYAPLASDALRTGLLVVGKHDGSDGFRQLALYPDAATAQSVARELRDEYVRCASTSEGESRVTWTTEQQEGLGDVTIATASSVYEGKTFPGAAVAIVVRGNAVLMVQEAAHDNPEQVEPPKELVRQAAADNAELICEVADC